MGACSCKALSSQPTVAYAQTHSRSQVHEVAVFPLTTANFPTPDSPAFTRLYDIYCNCPRVRQHFANAGEQALPKEIFYKQVVLESSNPNLPDGQAIPVAVATRWRGEAAWDIAGYIGCRSFDASGARLECASLQMFFKDGHKVPLTMPAIQLAARLFVETHLLATANQAGGSSRVPWPHNVEWTVRRSNMEVRRVIESALVFWGLRPSRTGGAAPHHHADMMPGANMYHPHGMPPQQTHPALADCAPQLPTFPLEQRSLTDDLITVGSQNGQAMASLLTDLASWSSSTTTHWATTLSSTTLGDMLPSNFIQMGGRVLTTNLSMNFRGTQQKTPLERRDIIGAFVADMLEHIQPAARDPSDQVPADAVVPGTPVHRDQPRAAPKGRHAHAAAAPVPQAHQQHKQQHPGAAVPAMVPPQSVMTAPVTAASPMPALALPQAPAGYTYVLCRGESGEVFAALVPGAQQQQQGMAQAVGVPAAAYPAAPAPAFATQQQQQQLTMPAHMMAAQQPSQHVEPSAAPMGVFGGPLTAMKPSPSKVDHGFVPPPAVPQGVAPSSAPIFGALF